MLAFAFFAGAYSQQINDNTSEIDDLKMQLAMLPTTFPPIEIIRRLDSFDFRLSDLDEDMELVKRALDVPPEFE